MVLPRAGRVAPEVWLTPHQAVGTEEVYIIESFLAVEACEEDQRVLVETH